MPQARMVEAVNTTFTAEGVARIVETQKDLVDRLGSPGTLEDVAAELLGFSDDEVAYLRSMPTSVKETIRSAAYSALQEGKAIQLHYRPGYDFQATVFEYASVVGIHVEGPYTGAPFPREAFGT